MSSAKLEQAKRKWEEKLASYEYELAITSNAPQKFELQERIKECQQEIERIIKKIESLQKESQSQNNQSYTQFSKSVPPPKWIKNEDAYDNGQFKIISLCKQLGLYFQPSVPK